MKHRFWLSIVALGAVCASVVWAGGTPQRGEETARPVTVRYAHMNTAGSIMGQQASAFSEAVSQVTDGRVTVEVYPDSQLGGLQEQLEMAASGAVAFHHNTWASLSSLIPEFGVFNIPYVVESEEDLVRVLDLDSSPIMQRLNNRLIEEQGLRIIAIGALGNPRHLTTRDRPVYQPSDLAGQNIRAIPFPVFITAVRGLGGIPTPIDFADLPTALVTGTVLGQENPIETIRNAQMYESQKYLMLTGHIQGSVPILVNERQWQSFSERERVEIQRVAQEVANQHNQMTINNAQATLQYLKDRGMTVIGPEDGLRVDLFVENTQRFVEEAFGAQLGDILREVREYLGY